MGIVFRVKNFIFKKFIRICLMFVISVFAPFRINEANDLRAAFF